MSDLKGKTLFITGASRGIGRAIALACADAGATVGIHYFRSEADAIAVRDEIARRRAANAHLLRFDVTSPEQIQAGVDRFIEDAGRIDAWVNNAAENVPGLLATSSVDDIRRQVEANLLGPIFCVRTILPAMIAQKSGVILNIGSVAATRPTRGQSVYAATKGGLDSFTYALAAEAAKKGIRALCIRPGPIETSMLESTLALARDEVIARIPMRRIGSPVEVADLAVYLLSDRASFLTGSVHSVDGGYERG